MGIGGLGNGRLANWESELDPSFPIHQSTNLPIYQTRMEGNMKAKVWQITLVSVLLAGILAGCGTAVTSETETSTIPAEGGGSEGSGGTVLADSYENALPASSQLALGTFLLEGTENEVTPEQAGTLLPLWQVIESGSLKGEAETGAVMKQIEGAMTADQLAAISAMQLTMEDLGGWMQAQGVDLAPPSGAADGSGGFAPPEGMAPPDGGGEEEMAAIRAKGEAGGGFPPSGGEAPGGSGPFGDMSDEDRASMQATAEAGGMTRPGGGAPGGGFRGQLAILAEQVIGLLTERAGGMSQTSVFLSRPPTEGRALECRIFVEDTL
jgi:hypothetical protein